MGETTMRLASSRPLTQNGVKAGGGGASFSAKVTPLLWASQEVTSATRAGSRSARLSYVMRLERVIRLKLNWIASCFR